MIFYKANYFSGNRITSRHRPKLLQ